MQRAVVKMGRGRQVAGFQPVIVRPPLGPNAKRSHARWVCTSRGSWDLESGRGEGRRRDGRAGGGRGREQAAGGSSLDGRARGGRGREQTAGGYSSEGRERSRAADGRRSGDGVRDGRARANRWERAGGRREAFREGGGEARWDARERGDWGGGGRQEDMTVERTALRAAQAAEGDDLLYGVQPVLIAMQTRRRAVRAVFVQARGEGGASRAGPAKKAGNEEALESIVCAAEREGIAVMTVSKGDLNVLSNNRPHQGIVMQASKRDFTEMKRMEVVTAATRNGVGRAPCYLVLDEIADPQNAGALLRSALFLGADGVVMCKRNSCALSGVVSKASAGALEKMDVYGVSSMPRFLSGAREDGWRVIGMGVQESGVALKEVALEVPTLVVLGSEGRGLRKLVRQACDLVVRIDGVGGVDDDVDSLNVSVAGAIALFQLLGK